MIKEQIDDIRKYSTLKLAAWIICISVGGFIVGKLAFNLENNLALLLGTFTVPLGFIIAAFFKKSPR